MRAPGALQAAVPALGVLLALGAAAPALAEGPITLDEALAAAASSNLDLQIRRTESESAGVGVYGSYAGVLPRLDLSAAFGRDFISGRDSVQVVPQLGTDPATGLPTVSYDQRVVSTPASNFADYTLGLQLQQPLWDGLRSWNAIAKARALERAAARQLDETSLAVAFEVTRRFYEVVKAEEGLRVLEATAERSRELAEQTEALFQAGRASRADTLAARVNLGSDRIQIEQQRSRVAQARADLSLALGRTADTGLSVVVPSGTTGPGLPALDDPPPEPVLLDRARQARALLASQSEQAAAAELDRSIARGAWWPTLGVQASYSRQGTELAGSNGVYGDPSRQYVANVQLYLQWNLFAGRETLAGEQRAEVALRRARLQSRQAEQQVSGEIARARAGVLAQVRSVGLAAENLATAEKNAALATERLAAGAASQIELRDASLKLTQAQLTLLQARVDLVVTRADLNRAVGGAL